MYMFMDIFAYILYVDVDVFWMWVLNMTFKEVVVVCASSKEYFF